MFRSSRRLPTVLVGGLILALVGLTGCFDDDDSTNNPTNGGGDLTGAVQFTLVSGHAGALNHYPGLDGYVGTADDHVGTDSTAMNMSIPNTVGSFSYNAFDFTGIGLSDSLYLPATYNAVTFLQGTITVDADAMATTGTDGILSTWNVSGTEPFPGHGAYSAVISAVNSGTYDTATKQFTINIDFTATLTGGPDTSSNFTLTGTAYLIAAADFGTATGDTYIDNVLIPMANASGATHLLVLEGEGTVPAPAGFSWPQMPVKAVIVAIKT
jgi:hypothetical protein